MRALRRVRLLGLVGLFGLVGLSPAGAAAQSGFAADRLQPCLVRSGLLAACDPRLPAGPWLLAAQADYAHHLLGIDVGAGEPTRWAVERRWTLRAELGWRPGHRLLLAAGLDGVADQRGRLTDARGAALRAGPARGRSWLAALWSQLPPRLNWALGLESRLVFPSPDPQGLAGPGRLRWEFGLLASARLGPLRPVLDLGLVLGEQVRFRDLRRGPALRYATGIEWECRFFPLAASAEIHGLTPLAPLAADEVEQVLEWLAGLRLGPWGGIALRLGLGVGLLGPGAPAVRAITALRLQIPQR